MADFTIFSKPLCSNCDRAKTAITVKGLTYDEVLHDTDEDIAIFKEKGYRSFPMVFHGPTLIGTADQTVEYLRTIDTGGDDF